MPSRLISLAAALAVLSLAPEAAASNDDGLVAAGVACVLLGTVGTIIGGVIVVHGLTYDCTEDLERTGKCTAAHDEQVAGYGVGVPSLAMALTGLIIIIAVASSASHASQPPPLRVVVDDHGTALSWSF